MIFSRYFFLSIFFLLGLSFITSFFSAILKLGKHTVRDKLKTSIPNLFFFRVMLLRFFRKNEWENYQFCLSCTKNILVILFTASFWFYLFSLLSPVLITRNILILTLIVLSVGILFDFMMRLFTAIGPNKMLVISSPIASSFLTIFCPIVFILLKITRFFSRVAHSDEGQEDIVFIKQKMKEVLTDTQERLDPHDKKLIASFVTFQERVAREIMVPRIDICALPSNITIRKASQTFLEEGYSRIPIYKDTLDHIMGVVLYKDLLEVYVKGQTESKEVDTLLEKIVKPVIYAPENKKISHLLQEFKAKQLHLAIIVNEYGGTEGIVTIEDILEELVGEIEDEYDQEEDRMYWKLPEGSIVINAKMSIVDIEDELNISIPHHSQYETLGGFIFHKAGTIPKKGWSLYLDDLHLEVINSDERSVKKILVSFPQKHNK